MRLIRGFLRVFFVMALTMAILPLARPLPSAAAIQPGPGKGWLTIASRSDPDDAIAIARQYANRFPSVIVFQSSNGYYGISLGWANIGEAQPLLQSLISSGSVPADSYFTAGARFVRAIWSPSNAQTLALPDLLAATYLRNGSGQAPPAASQPRTATPSGQPGYVTGLDATGDNFLSLRTGPGSGNREIARMRANTTLSITGQSGNWYQVTLDNGMNGWAYGRYIAFGQVPGSQVPMVGPSASASVPEIGPDTNQQAAPAPQQQTTAPQQAEPAPQQQASVPAPKPEKPAAIADQKRVALVMGNSAYENTAELPNPRNDAAAMAAKLTSLGFEVTTALDGTKAAMEGAVRDFVRAMDGADVALLFYAGHGMQVNGINYLIPVDAKLEDSTALDFETISLDTVLAFMNQEGRISIALLDACRDNPLSRRFTRSLGATRSAFIGRGLAAPSSGTGQVLIGFSTAPGEVAQDGVGKNSPFTTALLHNMDAKGLEVELMFKRVKQEVYDATEKEQEPWINSALRKEFYFNPQ
ncbi:MAG: caspase family protein [Salaquimonas sp.]|jgi:uncharacterized protein YraI|nr:caspase family protein [Salaquimonas sp.]